MDDSAWILWGILFGSIGTGYLIYGIRQRRGMALVTGVALCVIPYFVSNLFLMIPLCIAFIALPYFVSY